MVSIVPIHSGRKIPLDYTRGDFGGAKSGDWAKSCGRREKLAGIFPAAHYRFFTSIRRALPMV
jgi:hypothetical protein